MFHDQVAHGRTFYALRGDGAGEPEIYRFATEYDRDAALAADPGLTARPFPYVTARWGLGRRVTEVRGQEGLWHACEAGGVECRRFDWEEYHSRRKEKFMSQLIDDLRNLAAELEPDERMAQAARIDACIDELVKGDEEAAALKEEVARLTGERDEALKMRDEYRDRFVDIYFKGAPAAQPEQKQPENDTIKPVVRGANDLCGGWKKG